MKEVVDSDIPMEMMQRLVSEMLGEIFARFIAALKYEQDDDNYYVIAELVDENEDIIKVSMPKENK